MRKLFTLLMLLSFSIGTWAGAAEGFEMKEGDIGVWFTNDDSSLSPEKVIKIEVTKEGGLKAALDELTAILTGEGEQKPHYANFRTKLDEAYDGNTDFIANNRFIVKVVYTGEGSLSLSNDDISALNSLNIPTIDLQDLNPASAFTLSNSNVKNLILPDQWTMAQVQAAAQGCSSLNAALSIGTDVGAGTKIVDNQEVPVVLNVGSLVAYVKTPGTLYQSTIRLGYDKYTNTKLGEVRPHNFALTGLKLVTITGTPSARDFNGAKGTEAVKFDADGHFVFDKEADETSTDKNAALGGGSRKLLGTTKTGALAGSNLTKLDLGDAIITDEHYSDLTISWSYSCVSTSLKEIVFPTTPQLTKLPADCLNGDYALLEELCIPGNIKVLKTRSCLISTRVWTTGTTEHMVYDNGAYLVPAAGKDPVVDHLGHAPLDDTTWNAGMGDGDHEGEIARYGTITLPEGLTLIESNNFTAQSVSDVYVLSTTAPECHVDAFSTIMYLGNNTIDTQYIQQQGMVTRQAYAQSVKKGQYIAFLHYPSETGTPNIQRYTDPTREYSVATTLRDGKGNVIYFPNQSELNRAYLQGTTGYLWYAWDYERVPGPAGNENSFANFQGMNALGAHTTAAQQQANDFYLANNMSVSGDADLDKTTRTFYDVRLDTDGQPSLAKPADLEWYYDQYRSEKQLYPRMVTTQTQTWIGEVQSQDAEGHLLYRLSEEGETCGFVQDYSYVQNDGGEYYWDRTVTENENGNKVRDYNVVTATNGTYYHPLVDRNNQNMPKPWYSNTPTYDECDRSIATHAGPNGNTGWLVTIDDWNAKESTEYSWAAGSVKFYRSIPHWAQDDNSGQYYISTNFAIYTEGATDFVAGVNETRYNKVYKDSYRDYNASTDEGETRYDVVDNGIRAFNSETDTDNSKRYNKEYKDYTYREFDSSKDDANEPRYCPVMEDVYAVEKGTQYDYRGWHQFILSAYANNEDTPSTPVKFYQSDSDWWTVCFPYDLRYNDMIQFFGNGDKKPYLSKLRYVVRDYDKEKITLMFSKNLMVYKETITNPSATDDYVHGVIDDVTTWIGSGEGQYADEAALKAANPIILHKGVPYLIKPEIPKNANRSFKIYQNENAELYKRLNDAQYVNGGTLESYIYKGEYTVPAYVIGETAPEATVATRDFPHTMGPTFSYSSSDQITYGGKKVDARISGDFSYTFVGSFFLSLMPKDCYFLGWDSKKGRAAFWFNKTPNYASYDWNNQTGIICPNFNTSLGITKAESLSKPAKWSFGASDISNDNLIGGTNGAKRGLTDMDWGEVDVVVTGIGKINVDNAQNNVVNNDVIYDMRGVRMNRPLSRLPKGVYIVNGKKYVVE